MTALVTGLCFCILGAIATTASLTLMLATSLLHNPSPLAPLILLVPFMIFGFFLFATISQASELRDQLPDDWPAKIDKAAAMAKLGNPIPNDAVDRQWLKHIRDAVDCVPLYPMISYSDPLRAAEEQARRDATMHRVVALIAAARAAGGVRLPPTYTPSD